MPLGVEPARGKGSSISSSISPSIVGWTLMPTKSNGSSGLAIVSQFAGIGIDSVR
jgi:hypothetical protein